MDDRYSAKADWLHTKKLRPCWPPSQIERPAPGGTGSEAETQTIQTSVFITAERAAARAMAVALKRAAELDALGLGQRAAELREAAI